MKLRFIANGDQLVALPGSTQYAGQVARYYNRTWNEKLHGFPALPAPFECDSESKDGARATKLAQRDGALLPFDQETADFLGVPFVPHTHKDGAWVPSVVSASQAKRVATVTAAASKDGDS